MARTRLFLNIRKRWWFGPYMWLALAFVWSVSPFLDEDDDRMETWIDRQSKWLAEHGLIYETSAEDPGNDESPA